MLERLLIQNFQCHGRLSVEFDPRITCIVGPSDVGKSAIIRALRWIAMNQPQGDSFIREGEKGCTVQLFIDGRKIGRKRGRNGDNIYLMDDEEFRSFGVDVPNAIKKVLNVNTIGFQGQHESPFWFGLTSGEVSRELNSIVDLGIIDSSQYEIGRIVRERQQTVKICKSRLDAAKDREESLRWIEEADSQLRSIEATHRRLEARRGDVVRLSRQVAAISKDQSTANRSESQRIELSAIGSLAQKIRKLHDRCTSLKNGLNGADAQKRLIDRGAPDTSGLDRCKEEWSTTSRKRRDLESLLTTTLKWQQKVDFGVPDISHMGRSVQQYREVQAKRTHLTSTIKSAERCEEQVRTHEDRCRLVEEELHKSTEGICPVCGQEMSINTLKPSQREDG